MQLTHHFVEGLNKLLVLDMERVSLEPLPASSFCRRLEVIRPNVLSRLTHLEELNLENSFTKWEGADGVLNANLSELKNFPCLTNLKLVVPNVNLIPMDMFCEKLENYDISIGPSWSWSPLNKYTSRRTLKLELSPYGVLK